MQQRGSQTVGRIRGRARNDRSQEMIKAQLRRIYVLLWVVWGLWCLYWPIYNQDQRASNLRARNLEVFKSCLDSDPDHEHCRKAQEKAEEDLEASAVSPYSEKIAIPFLTGLILIPPLIVYGLLFRAGPWLARKGEEAAPHGGRRKGGRRKMTPYLGSLQQPQPETEKKPGRSQPSPPSMSWDDC
jgi:hypothetical protein